MAEVFDALGKPERAQELRATGSVWPHDSAMIAIGFKFYRFAADRLGSRTT